jgi:hypothetical protein
MYLTFSPFNADTDVVYPNWINSGFITFSNIENLTCVISFEDTIFIIQMIGVLDEKSFASDRTRWVINTQWDFLMQMW